MNNWGRRNHEEKLKKVIEKIKNYFSGEVKVIFHVNGSYLQK